jgi:kynurenine formamidase
MERFVLTGGRLYDLEQPRYYGSPTHPAHLPGFIYSLHRRHEAGWEEPRTSASGLVVMAEHSGTHIDAFCHQAENLTLYGGVEVDSRVQTSTGFTRLGIETVPPLITRGVLIDVAGHLGVERVAPDRTIEAADLELAAAAQDTELRPGDTVLVRTGNGALWQEPEEYLRGAGIAASASRLLAGRRVSAVGADNVAWDVVGAKDPEMGVTLPGHVILLVRHGIHIIENLLLEELARDRRFEFTFICLPLKMRGATGSPVRPVAVATS